MMHGMEGDADGGVEPAAAAEQQPVEGGVEGAERDEPQQCAPGPPSCDRADQE